MDQPNPTYPNWDQDIHKYYMNFDQLENL